MRSLLAANGIVARVCLVLLCREHVGGWHAGRLDAGVEAGRNILVGAEARCIIRCAIVVGRNLLDDTPR